MHPIRCFLLMTALMVGLAKLGFATTIDPLTFPELVLSSDFLGVIECETAGGIVARYTVLESWKGTHRPGDIVTIRVAVNYWEPQFPMALCGQQFVVAVYKDRAPNRMMSTTSGGPVPLWWRDIPTDYRTPLFQGWELLGQSDRGILGSSFGDLGSCREAAEKLLAAPDDNKKIELFRAIALKYTARDKGATADRIKIAATIDEIAGAVQDNPDADPGTLQRVERAFVRSIALLEPPAKRRDDRESAESGEEQVAAAPTQQDLARYRRALTAGPGSDDFGEAFERLTLHDPQTVATYLVDWVNTEDSWRREGIGYGLGSYFAWRCGKDRAACLTRLLDAKDPEIRVAGAVYLCFEDERRGMEALKSLSDLRGDPGAWAALTRLRRGDKSAMKRALEVMRPYPGIQNMSAVPHRNLQKRLLVLLSNSAKFSGLDQPEVHLSSDDDDVSAYEYYHAWWTQHETKVNLHDPWFAVLAVQKID